MKAKLKQGDCHEELPKLEENVVDLCLVDPPYSVTSASWDQQPLDWENLWEELNRVVKETAPFVFTASQPFTTDLIQSNREAFRYTLVWVKESPSGALNAKKKPMTKHEDVVVFYRKAGAYNSLAEPLDDPIDHHREGDTDDHVYMDREPSVQTEKGFATSVIRAGKRDSDVLQHPTGKPTDLMVRLIKMYSDEGDTVLDFTMGSGTTGVASMEENRDFIGFERKDKYFKTAQERIEEAKSKQSQIQKFFE